MSSIESINAQTAPVAAPSLTSQALGKEDFLRLLVAQLENQDPLNPADATEFTAQLAQFSSLEQLFNVNESLTGLATLSSDMEQMSALGLIGNEVIAETDQFELGADPIQLGYQLDAPAEEAMIHILNQSDQTVASFSAPELTSGGHQLAWDGTDNNGNALPPGSYSIAVVALNAEEQYIDTSTSIHSIVTGVDLSGSNTEVVTQNGNFAMQNVSSVLGAAL